MKKLLVILLMFGSTAKADCLWNSERGCSEVPLTIADCKYYGVNAYIFFGTAVGYLCREAVTGIDYWQGSSKHYEYYANEYLKKLNKLKKKCGKRCR
jgi:hypothetical protein